MNELICLHLYCMNFASTRHISNPQDAKIFNDDQIAQNPVNINRIRLKERLFRFIAVILLYLAGL